MDLVRLLRADVPPVQDEQFVVTLAEVARSSPIPPVRRRVPLGLKVGAIAASVAVTMFGAAYASDLLAPPPTNTNPTSPGTDDPSERERDRKSDEPVDGKPPPVTRTESPGSDGEPSDHEESTPGVGTADATEPAGTEDQDSPEGPVTEPAPPQSDPALEDDDESGDDDESSGDDDSEDEPDSDDDSDDDSGPDDDSDDDDEGSGDENDPDEDSSGPEPEDENNSPDDD